MKSLEEQTKQILRENNLYANKQLGQNFLINLDIIENIVKEADVGTDDLVIEIGPGLGSLTSELLNKAGKVVCIELDMNMIQILNKRFSQNPRFSIIHQDVLKADLRELIKKEKEINGLKKAKVVANLPYYITTPIIMRLLEEKLNISSITVMVQNEVAERLTATPGEKYTGAITYTINYYCKPKVILKVPKENFIPVPKVDSAVIQLEVLNNPSVEVKDEKLFFEIIKYAFMQKRKTLVNAIGGKLAEKDRLQIILKNMGLDEKIRAEKMTIEQFARTSG